MQNKIFRFSRAALVACGSVVGKKEHDGPLGASFDLHDETDRFGMSTWERAESEMQRMALGVALGKCGLSAHDVDALLAGDLLNQCVGSSYGLLDFDIPYFGLYGACSTAIEGLMLSAILCSSDYAETCAAVTSSHYCAAERQYRTPLEYGSQRSPTAQWTVTGAGAFLVRKEGRVRICEGLPGIVREKGIRDASNMGAAMAPAAADTLSRYFSYSSYRPEDFDWIVTGDLGAEGGAILCDLLAVEGLDIRRRYRDCGTMIYDRASQDVHAGGSGCGCSAVVLAAHLYPKLWRGELRRILLLGTGAMMSPASLQQGESIPAVAHLLHLCSESDGEGEAMATAKERRIGR